MSKLVRFGISLEEGLLKDFDRYIKEKEYGNRSEAIRDLIREGLSRDIIRRIQEMRRLMDLPVEAFIDVYIQVPIEDDKKSLQDYETYLREEIRAHNLTVTLPVSVKGEDVDFEKIWTIEERTFHIGIKKVEETRVNS